MECPRCKKEVTKIVKKNRAGEDINLCRGCYAWMQYAVRKGYPVRRRGQSTLSCEHEEKWRNGMKVCTTCYNAFWRENKSNICVCCGRGTKWGLTPKCDRCLGRKIIKDLNEEEMKAIKIFLVKARWNLITPIDRLRMTHLYLGMGLYWKSIEATTPEETEEYILNAFSDMISPVETT